MDHIFDNRHYLQSLVVTGGNKVSVLPPSGKHSIKLEDAQRIFFLKFSDLESGKIKNYLFTKFAKETDTKEIVSWCEAVLENTLSPNRSLKLNEMSSRINLRELFIERVLSDGCAKAIIFLHTYYFSPERKINREASRVVMDSQEASTVCFSESV